MYKFIFTKGCNGSVYGSNCDKPCPINCRYSISYIQSGTCFGCKPGWTGAACNISILLNDHFIVMFTNCQNFYLAKIIFEIIVNINLTLKGTQNYMCVSNVIFITQIYCVLECMRSWYGVNCSRPCVGYCKDNTTCNHVTGQCNGGCNAGWTGIFCDKGIFFLFQSILRLLYTKEYI